MRLKSVIGAVRRLLIAQDAATAIEFGLIAVAAITAMNGLGDQLKTTFNTTSSSMSLANATAAA